MSKFSNVSGGRIACAAWVLALAGACAPKPSGPDQVADINYQVTTSADEALDNVSYPEADDVMEDLTGGFAPGCALGLVVDGEVVYLKGYGWADEGAGIPWDVGTTSAVGSVSKTFTALALLRLAEQGQLQLSDTVDTHLAPTGLYGGETLESLLLHTSGIGGNTQAAAFAPEWGGGPDEDAYPVENPMAHPRYAYDAYAPFTLYSALNGTTNGYDNGVYSNVGYTVLGAVIDSITATPAFAPRDGYERWLWYEVGRGQKNGGLKTLALGHSWRDGDIPGFAQGTHNGAPAEMWDGVGSVEGWEGPAGGWTMTVGDLARFVAAVHKREIVSAASWAAATEGQSWVNNRPYGYGMFVETVGGFPGSKHLWHGGDIDGYSALWASWEGMGHPPFGVAMQCTQTGSATLHDRAEDLLWKYITGQLQPELPIGLGGPVSPSEAPGRYRLDFSEARVDGAGLGLPNPVFAGDVALDVRLGSGRSFLLTLIAAASPVAQWQASFGGESSEFLSGSQRLSLPTRYGTAVLENATWSGRFGKDAAGRAGTSLRLSGRLDTRSLAPVLGRVNACAAAASLGRPCGPCADGVAACVPATITGIVGKP